MRGRGEEGRRGGRDVPTESQKCGSPTMTSDVRAVLVVRYVYWMGVTLASTSPKGNSRPYLVV